MHVWDYRNRRHRGRVAHTPTRAKACANKSPTRDCLEHEAELQEEEIKRQQLEDAEVEIKKTEIRRVIVDYMDDPSGKQELDEVVENLRHWKESFAALGHDSDGEVLPDEGQQTSESFSAAGVAKPKQRRRENKKVEHEERRRRKKAREIFDMIDSDGDRSISAREMKFLLDEICIPMDKRQMKALMMEIDTNGSGEVDFDEFYRWYRGNAVVARNADKTQTAGLFATKLVKGLTGLTRRKEAIRIIIAHAQWQVEKRARAHFRLCRPPRLVCDVCGEAFSSEKDQRRHYARREVHHEAWEAAEREASRRFYPVAALLDHAAPKIVEGELSGPFKATEASTARKKRLRRLMFSDKFYVLYGGGGFEGVMMGSGVGRPEFKAWENKVHPRVPDPDDRRGDQLRRGQCVEGINPADPRGKVALEVTRGGLSPNWGGVRRGRLSKRVAGRDSIGIQHMLLRLVQEKARAKNVFIANDALQLARVKFRWEGWSMHQVLFHAEFNRFKGESMKEDQTPGYPGREVHHLLSPGTYRYYFAVDGQRRIDESLPVVVDVEGSSFNVVTVMSQHLGEEGNRALSTYVPLRARKLQDGSIESATFITGNICDKGAISRCCPSPSSLKTPTLVPDVLRGGPTIEHPTQNTCYGAVAVMKPETTELAVAGATRTTLTSAGLNSSGAPMTSIDLSRHQICDDGASALALALRHNVHVKEINLSFNMISGMGIAALAASLQDPRCQVETLRLAQNGFGLRGGEHLGMMLSGGERKDAWGKVPRLRELNLADNRLGDDGVEALSRGIPGHPCLNTLILDGNDIGRDGTQHLCEALLQNASLKYLSLQRNYLLADATQEIAKMLQCNGMIESLGLAYNPFGSEGLLRLSSFLDSNTRLEKLGLRGCGVQAQGVRSGVRSLCRRLRANRVLTSLDLAANELDEYAGQELAHALLKNKTLTEITLTGNNIPEEWLRRDHWVCSEIYQILPSLAESLRINCARKESGQLLCPRSVERKKNHKREARAAEQRNRQAEWKRRVKERRRLRRRRRPKQGMLREDKEESALPGEEEEEEKKEKKGVTLAGDDSRVTGDEEVEEVSPLQGEDMDQEEVQDITKEFLETLLQQPQSPLQGEDIDREEVQDKTQIMMDPPAVDIVAKEFLETLLQQPVASTNNGESYASSATEARNIVDDVGEDGLLRVPGVWTRGSVWAPTLRLGGAKAGCTTETGGRLGDQHCQCREDEEVAKAGKAKREELSDYLVTTDGHTLVARVAKLLTYARHQEDREKRAAKRTQLAELRAHQQRIRQQRRQQKRDRSDTWHDAKGATVARIPRLTGSSALATRFWGGGGATKRLYLGATANSTSAERALHTTTMLPSSRWKEVKEGLEATSEEGGSRFMMSTIVTGAPSTFPLPSAAVAVVMEMEDDADAKRALGERRLEQQAWNLVQRPRFLEAFGRFDPEGRGEIPISELGDLMAQLLLPEAVRPEEIEAVAATLVKKSDEERRAASKAASKVARSKGLNHASDFPRPFTVGTGEKTVRMLHVWRWHRHRHFQWQHGTTMPSRGELRLLASQQKKRWKSGEISRDWARRVILAVGEREARLQAVEVFRGHEPPRFVCPECHEFGFSSGDQLDEHLRDGPWHEVHATLEATFEENADLVAVAKRFAGGEKFPDYYHIARDLPEETTLPVFKLPTELSSLLGNITFEMLVLVLAEEDEWLKINFKSYRDVYVKYSGIDSGNRRRTFITRMYPSAARTDPKEIAFSSHLSTTMTTTLKRSANIISSGLCALGLATASALNSIAFAALHGHRPVREPEALAPRTAIFKTRVVRFVLPRVFCHAPGLPPGAQLKVRAEPGGADDAGDGSVVGKVLGRVAATECVIALASSGDWLQVRYKHYEVAWMLAVYRERRLMAPFADVHPGVVIKVTAETSNKAGNNVRDSPFPMPPGVLDRDERGPTGERTATAAVADLEL